MGSKVIEAVYIPEDGMSYVVKAGRWGTFAEIAACAEADRDVASNFTGCNFAEYKCDIHAQKEKAKYYRARYDGIDMAYNNLLQSIPPTDRTMDRLYRQRNIAWRDYLTQRNVYKDMIKNYRKYTEDVLKARRGLNERIEEVNA